MKFSVRVGEEFPCHEVAHESTPVVINITHGVNAPSGDSPKRRAVPWPWAAAIVFVGAFTVPATLYGMATGDYSTLRAIAEAGRDVLQAGAKLVK